MPDLASWKASIGRVYRTRRGMNFIVVDTVDDRNLVLLRSVNKPESRPYAYQLDGRCPGKPEDDLMEMDRTTNMDGAK